jgi:ribulose 1,5-bisphosphate synthetase/thiazole synthase
MTNRVKIDADVVIVGAGPATIGLLCNAVKNNK